MSRRPRQQVKSKERGATIKRLYAIIKQFALRNATRATLLAMVFFVLISYPISKSLTQNKEIEEEQLIEEQHDLEAKTQPDVFVFEEIENPYSFYDLLESRTFLVEGEEKKGGVEYISDDFEPTPEIKPVEAPPKRVVNVQKPDVPLSKRLQVGSFSSSHEASIHRKQLESYGYNPQVVEGKIPSGKSVYRVIIGPFSPKEMTEIKAQLRTHNIDHFEVNY
ncbi:SPOR domain-containing protein [Ignatzschineria sp. RMDPL8A]|uniref:SPOR domain-containing protein n=1 Tax=Ignatzschineria sp. RMDPL8A TaxID=2999236 RepID=UPI0016B2B895|nr:SPOR domain-containing protein [Ignatzschineria sp. RMDPL8A]MDG9729211.1 SPOR domain-containing protein [Ignatzschineria sp. RMDPL8A]NLD08293.1 SPOR domain-containing protein [Xanthomonadaceae bacterium]